MQPTLPLNTTYEFDYVVVANDSPRASRVGAEDEFPDVLSTARMIGLMEIAAARLMQPLLYAEELSVGVRVEVDHLAATPLFATLKIRATYLGQTNKHHSFKVEIFDSAGLAGHGTHTRAIVTHQRLLAGAQRRTSTPQGSSGQQTRGI